MPAARRTAAHYFVPAFRDFSLPSSCRSVSRLHSLGQGAGGKGCCPAAPDSNLDGGMCHALRRLHTST